MTLVSTDETTSEATPIGYSIILPPGWAGIPLRDRKAQDAAVRKIVDEACAGLPENFPRDKVTPYRLEIERRLRRGVDQAKSGAGLDLYLPIYQRGSIPLGASFVVAEIAAPPGSFDDPKSLLSLFSNESESIQYESVQVAEVPAVRRDSFSGADLQMDVESPSRRVDYVIPVPHDSSRWVVVSFSTIGAGNPEDEIATATVELFDAIMTTFVWRSA